MAFYGKYANGSPALEEVRLFRRGILARLYHQCTPEQQALFNRMYGSLESISEEKIDWAIQQCERTVEKNKKKRVGS